jgi:integrase
MPYSARRKDSQSFWFEQRIPRDLLPRLRGREIIIQFPPMKDAREVLVQCRVRDAVRFSLRTTDNDVRLARTGLAIAYLQSLYEAARNGPKSLTPKQLVALSGEVYRLYATKFDENPGSPSAWAAWKSFNRAALEGRLANAPPIEVGAVPADELAARDAFGQNLTAGVNALSRSDGEIGLESRFGKLTSWVLTIHGLEVDSATRLVLLREVARAAQDAGWRNKRASEGDWSPDPNEKRFPPIAALTPSTSVTLADLFDRWKAEAKPAASTITTWRGSVRRFASHVKNKDAASITREDVIGWKDALLAEGLKAKTIRDGHLAAIRRLFAFGIDNRILQTNPAQGVRVALRRRAGEGRQPYTDEEVARLLALARAERNEARRWLPWLATLTGARIGELAQLRGANIRKVDGVLVLELRPAPDGGSFKNEGSERFVPLHPALVKEGFGSFVESKGSGPLFYTGRVRKGRQESSRHASKGVTNRLAGWIRASGFNDPRKAPSHALRRWFKITADRVGIATAHSDIIQGHSARTEGDGYRRAGISMATVAELIAKIPVPLLDEEVSLGEPALFDTSTASPEPITEAVSTVLPLSR